jgi:hypothetical protein
MLRQSDSSIAPSFEMNSDSTKCVPSPEQNCSHLHHKNGYKRAGAWIDRLINISHLGNVDTNHSQKTRVYADKKLY